MKFTAVYYEPDILNYPLGQQLKDKFQTLPWHEIESHNRIPEMTAKANHEFAHMKQYLILGTRKTHKYVENHKISDYLVPFTSSGCTAMCLYCYLVCNYNKCSYLRLFVNREEMLDRLLKRDKKSQAPLTFEVGSNSDLVLENTITGNLPWLIHTFGELGKGQITFPTKFHMIEPLLSLNHQGKTIFRMSVNPEEIIRLVEIGTSSLEMRIRAVNQMCEAGYPVGILIAPVILIERCEEMYSRLLDTLEATLSDKAKSHLTIEIIFMTYSFVHRAINKEAFPNALDLYDTEKMVGRGRGKYAYRPEAREQLEALLLRGIEQKLPNAKLIYIC